MRRGAIMDQRRRDASLVILMRFTLFKSPQVVPPADASVLLGPVRASKRGSGGPASPYRPPEGTIEYKREWYCPDCWGEEGDGGNDDVIGGSPHSAQPQPQPSTQQYRSPPQPAAPHTVIPQQPQVATSNHRPTPVIASSPGLLRACTIRTHPAPSEPTPGWPRAAALWFSSAPAGATWTRRDQAALLWFSTSRTEIVSRTYGRGSWGSCRWRVRRS